MPARSETRSIDAFLTTTLAEYGRTLHDNIFDDVPLLSYLNGKLGKALAGKGPDGQIKKVLTGGERIVEPLMYGTNSTVDSYSGSEMLDTTLQDGMTNASFDWAQYSVSIGIEGIQKRNNKGRHALINLLQAKTTQAEMTLQERLNQDAYKDGTGNNSKNIDGLDTLISATTTVGGLAPATYSWWKANVVSGVGSFATNGYDKMRTMVNDLTIGNIGPDMIMTTQSVYESFEDTLTAQRRYTDSKVGDVGFENLVFKNRPIVFDRDATSGYMYFLNRRYMKWVVHSEADMKMAEPGFQTPIGQDVSTALILFQGNTVINNRRRLGVLQGITA
jgi:hypothetical protein|tara:strand:- start:4110 stop:5105 length:996 start_codon:yes stop_codon:yes gene_type:complete